MKTVPSGWEDTSIGISEVASRLRFAFQKGQIWLDEERMVLMHSSALAALRKELIDCLGTERARGLLTRIGYAAGLRDAEIVRKSYQDLSDAEFLQKGPLLHALEGIVKVEAHTVEIDISKGHYFVDALWQNSIESHVHRALYGMHEGPVCWGEMGHASGYASGIMGKFILHKEVECSPRGCRFIGKPIDEWDEVSEDLRYYQSDSIVDQIMSLQDQVENLRSAIPERVLPSDLIGEAASFKAAWSLAEKAAGSPVTVLLLGETGVGKDVFARAIHNSSPRANKPFVAVNCGALPNDLIESELFGIERGAFTGAQNSRAGRFERADGGTLFLDEVGELSLAAQTRLLRALQSGEIDRLGDTATRKVDVRVIAATNVDLTEAVSKGTFRKDLYYRLNVFPVSIPPLRERTEDVLLLAERFLEKFSAREGKRVRGFTDKACHALVNYNWPGNVRELENVIERGIILAQQDNPIDMNSLFLPSAFTAEVEQTTGLTQSGRVDNDAQDTVVNAFLEHLLNERIPLEDLEAVMVKAAIERCDGNLSAAARLLGISRFQIGYKQKKRGL
ncbi:sigma 54-interacting transcriptional regulator [Pseudomonas aeruginosa]|jgi:two-component system, NtrC family, response regulator HydG|nr:sigma 54-interacting transcriptional regulator [Pseudomonas aeruginosa]MCS9139068.1 sigma 54-interacting transcriptional regulator [Pseudomonas aeruginosa]MCS9211951.1 sigma 54-interacting transcriptional regulator [Pseudomonas aeruginosa]